MRTLSVLCLATLLLSLAAQARADHLPPPAANIRAAPRISASCRAGVVCGGTGGDVTANLQPPVGPSDHILGAESPGGVTLVMFTDFQCPHCANMLRVVNTLRARFGPSLRVVYRHFPIEDHAWAAEAAEAAEAAGAQGKYWEMFTWLYAHQFRLTHDQLIEGARSLGLDVIRFKNELARHVYAPRVLADRDSGVRSGVTGTPTIFLNDRFAFFGETIEEALRKAILALLPPTQTTPLRRGARLPISP